MTATLEKTTVNKLAGALKRFLERDHAEMNAAAERRGDRHAAVCECGCCREAREALAQIEE